MKRSVFFVFLTVILFACRREQVVDYPVLSVDITRLNTPSVFDIFEKIEIIPLETTDNSLLGNIFGIVFYNSHYYITDMKGESLFCFDEHGKFVQKIGKVGQGPGEYTTVPSFAINGYNDVVEALSPWGFLYIYDLSGRLGSKTSLPMLVPNYQTSLIQDDSIRVFNYQISLILNDSIRILKSSVENEEDQLYVYSINSNTVVNSFYKENPVLDGFAVKEFYRYNNSIYYSKALISSVFKIDQYGYKIAYAWDFGKFNPERIKFDKDITNERLSEMFKSSQIKGVYYTKYQNDNYYYTAFVGHDRDLASQDPKDSEILTSVHVLYDKRDNKTYVFNKFKEYLYFAPLYWCNEYVLGASFIFYYKDIPEFIDSQVFDEENRNKLKAIKEDDNPFLIKYYFK